MPLIKDKKKLKGFFTGHSIIAAIVILGAATAGIAAPLAVMKYANVTNYKNGEITAPWATPVGSRQGPQVGYIQGTNGFQIKDASISENLVKQTPAFNSQMVEFTAPNFKNYFQVNSGVIYYQWFVDASSSPVTSYSGFTPLIGGVIQTVGQNLPPVVDPAWSFSSSTNPYLNSENPTTGSVTYSKSPNTPVTSTNDTPAGVSPSTKSTGSGNTGSQVVLTSSSSGPVVHELMEPKVDTQVTTNSFYIPASVLNNPSEWNASEWNAPKTLALEGNGNSTQTPTPTPTATQSLYMYVVMYYSTAPNNIKTVSVSNILKVLPSTALGSTANSSGTASTSVVVPKRN